MTDPRAAPTVTTASLEEWRRAAAKSVPGGDPARLDTQTADGITLKALYTRTDVEDLPHTDTLPGFAPYVRGPQASMYATRPWTIRQYAGFSNAEESNAFYRQALAAGGQGVSVPSTWPPIAATTPTIRAWPATSARPAWRSIRSRT